MMTNNFQSMFADCGFGVELFHWVSFGSLRVWQHCGADSVEGKYQQQKDMLTSNLYKSRCHCGKMHDGHPAWCRIDTVHVSAYDCGPNIPGGCAPTLGRVTQRTSAGTGSHSRSLLGPPLRQQRLSITVKDLAKKITADKPRSKYIGTRSLPLHTA
jgi:hypothetical protein